MGYAAIVISAFLLVLYFLLIEKIRKGWNSTPLFSPTLHSSTIPVSVIVACRNEELHIGLLLDALIAQQDITPESYEIIIINDGSTDSTLAIANTYAARYPSLITIIDSLENKGKKHAIDLGITASKYNLLLMTDADCIPHPSWIHTMRSHFEYTQSVFTCGPVEYKAHCGMLEKLQYHDGLNTAALIAAGYHHKTYANANGGNIMYTKQFYNEVDGFSSNTAYASGDDIFMAMKAMNIYPKQINFCKSQKALVATEPEYTVSDFLQQRKRWATKTQGYERNKLKKTQIIVAILSLWLVALLLLGLILDPLLIVISAGTWIIKTLMDVRYLSEIAGFFSQKLSHLSIWVTGVLYPFYMCYMTYVAIFPSAYTWKGRLTK